MTLRERVDAMRGNESVTAFAKRADIARQTLYKAFRRERRLGSHGIDQVTAERIAAAGKRSVAWVLGAEAEQRFEAPEEWYDEALTLLVRVGVHAAEARAILDRLLDHSAEALRREYTEELEHKRQTKRTVRARVRRNQT